MTDREKLCELICDGTNHDCGKRCNLTSAIKCYSCTSLADHLIANGVTFVADTNIGGKWIPVTERLPEETRVPKDVLVYHKLGNCGIHVDRAWYDSDKNKWRSALSMNMKVTHWMPLPEPPKED